MLSSLLNSTLTAISADASAQFSAGYLYGITSKDERDYMVGCFMTDADLNDAIDQAMADYKKGDQQAAEEEWKKAQPLFQHAMHDCHDVASDFDALKKYEEDVLKRPDAKEFIEANKKKYETELALNGGNEITQWQQGDYFNSGMFAGYSMQYMGLAPPRGGQDELAPAEFIAGWYYGVEGEDKRPYILSCYKASDDLTNALYDAMTAYIAGDQHTGDSKMEDTKKLYLLALTDCTDVNPTLENINDQAAAMVARDDWADVAKKIYDDNKDVIDRDVGLELREWTSGVFFNSGMFAGYVEKIFLDNVPAPTPTPSDASNRTDHYAMGFAPF